MLNRYVDNKLMWTMSAMHSIGKFNSSHVISSLFQSQSNDTNSNDSFDCVLFLLPKKIRFKEKFKFEAGPCGRPQFEENKRFYILFLFGIGSMSTKKLIHTRETNQPYGEKKAAFTVTS